MLETIALLAIAAASPGNPTAQAGPGAPLLCRKVTSPNSGKKPFDMCLTEEQWAAKKKADARDANRMVCRYEEAMGTRFKSFKICMTAAEWENQRLQQRQQIDRIQGASCVGGAGC
jgi:hypothetical protein